MKAGKIFSILLILVCCLAISPGISISQDNTGGGSGASNPFVEGLMNILQEGIDEWIGNYKGSLGDVKLLERVGNKVVLEVTYNNVKRSDNVYVQGDVLDMGSALEGFQNSLNSVSGSQGKVRLAIKWTPEGDEEWGTAKSAVDSDQIRLYLVRKSNPDRPFGEIVYDMTKTWTDSAEPDMEEEMTADAGEGIELADTESDTGVSQTEPSGPARPSGVFIKPGTILIPKATLEPAKPSQPATSPPPATVQTPPSASSPPSQPPVITTVKPIQAQALLRINTYDFYSKAGTAIWRSSAGEISYPGPANDPKGFARPVAKAQINPGNSAVSMIEMCPENKSTGWIDAHFPAVVLGENLKFKTIAAFRFGTNRANSATFQVYVKEDNKYRRVISQRATADKYHSLTADLSEWAGKKVQIVLRVRAGAGGSPAGAVWVKPRISK